MHGSLIAVQTGTVHAVVVATTLTVCNTSISIHTSGPGRAARTDVGAVSVAVTDVFGARLRQPHPEDSFAAANAERAGRSIRLMSSPWADVGSAALMSCPRALRNPPGLRRFCAGHTELVTVTVVVEVVMVLHCRVVSETRLKASAELPTLLE